MRLASCQNSHWSSVTVSTQCCDEGGKLVLNPFTGNLLFCLRMGRSVLDLGDRCVTPTGL